MPIEYRSYQFWKVSVKGRAEMRNKTFREILCRSGTAGRGINRISRRQRYYIPWTPSWMRDQELWCNLTLVKDAVRWEEERIFRVGWLLWMLDRIVRLKCHNAGLLESRIGCSVSIIETRIWIQFLSVNDLCARRVVTLKMIINGDIARELLNGDEEVPREMSFQLTFAS